MVNTDAIIVGAGFSGIYMLYRLRELGLSVQALEAGNDVGGTWYWHRYPGARCDTESLVYSYSFDEDLEQQWEWPERYPTQPEILKYVRHVAERFDLRRDIHFDTRVTAASFDGDHNKWTLKTDRGADFTAEFCVMATGCLSIPKVPDLNGLESFAGERYHTANWPLEGVDFSGKTVGMIGTGSSGIQSIPVIARQAKHLTVFQRTANFSIPAWNGRLTPEQQSEHKANYPALRRKARNSISGDIGAENVMLLMESSPQEREAELEKRWCKGGFNYQYAFTDALVSTEANELAAEFVRNKIRQRVKDPAVAAMLCPTNHPFGTKRLCVDTDYYETYNRDNVTLVDLRQTPITQMTRNGLETSADGYQFDALVLATGFDAMTGALASIDIRGKNGALLKEKWSDGPRAYLGLAVAGFPNLFTITGPGSPSVLMNMVLAGEQHVEWIAECITYLRANQIDRIEAAVDAEDAWVDHVNETADQTLFPQADSWYVGANVPGKPRVFMPYVDGFKAYDDICRKVVADGYRGFILGDRQGPTRPSPSR